MKVGIAGLGRMGGGMASTLLRSGVEVCGYDVNIGATEKFAKVKGFKRAENVSDLFICDFVILSLPTGIDVVNLMDNYDGQSIILDTTTISLQELNKIKDTLGKKETNYLSCKLERGPKEANEGKLAIFVGGDRQLYEKSNKILGMLGDHMYMGNHEQASMMKLISNMVGTAVVDIFGEISVLVRKLKIDPESAAKALSMGGASSVTQMFRLEWQSRDEFGESFSLELAQHVIEMALESARNAGVSNLPIIEQNNLMMKLARTMGIGKNDVSEISKMYWNLNNTKN
jgi:3-hydroxyisobutyrate dehydrogenase-like beta-hydroxyacid dehydrogenase